MKARPFNPKRDVNHHDFEGSPLCGRKGWAIQSERTTCKRCLSEIDAALSITRCVTRIGRALRGAN